MAAVPAKAQKRAAKAPKAPSPGVCSSSAAKRPTGRPSTYTDSIASRILTRISNGESLRTIVKDAAMPAQSTIYEWLLARPAFSEQYTRAREEQADTLADEIIAISDETVEMVIVKGNDSEERRIDPAGVNRNRLRVDARKWVAAKLRPKKYGDRLGLEGVENGAAIKTEDVGSSRLFEMIRNLELTKRVG